MLPDKKANTNIGIGLGILLQVAGRGLAYANEAAAIPALVMTLLGAVLFIWGCMNYAEGKGHSKWLGLLGLAELYRPHHPDHTARPPQASQVSESL